MSSRYSTPPPELGVVAEDVAMVMVGFEILCIYLRCDSVQAVSVKCPVSFQRQ